ncbi:MAG: hypothetical protein ABH843_00875 [Candidatus Omnitrophota bacterium]
MNNPEQKKDQRIALTRNAHLTKEIVITVANEIGVLDDLSRILSENSVNIEAISGYAASGKAVIMLLTDNNRRALSVLQKERYTSAEEKEVVVIDIINKPGTLRSITAKLAAEGIDIKHNYGTICPRGCPARIIISTSDNERAFLIFKE